MSTPDMNRNRSESDTDRLAPRYDDTDPGPLPEGPDLASESFESDESSGSGGVDRVDFPDQLFPVGRLVATPGALASIVANRCDPLDLVRRHVTGDWGNLTEDDRATNAMALKLGARLLSSYRLVDGQDIWLITEADRSATTLLRPDEY